MSAKWIICNLGKDRYIQSLYYGVLEAGHEAEVVPLRTANELTETQNYEKACVVVTGSIWFNTAMKQARPNWIGNWHNKSLFSCSSYYPFFKKHLTQQKHKFLTFAEIKNNRESLYDEFAVNDIVFVRPDSGEKEFPGELIERDKYNSWADKLLEIRELDPEEPCLISQPVKIKKELRLIVADGKVVSGSTYIIDRHHLMESLDEQDNAAEIVAFAERVLAESGMLLPPAHVIDIAVHDNRMSVMELGCFCCAGLYECDRRKVAAGVSIAAEKAYDTTG